MPQENKRQTNANEATHDCKQHLELSGAYRTATRVGCERTDPRMQTFIYECQICGGRHYEEKIVAELAN